MELIFEEDGTLVKTLCTHEEHEAALRLRHDIFREELRWVPPSPDGLDRDEYDSHAESIGVFNEGELIGHVRLITAPAPFMIEKDFRILLPPGRRFNKALGMAEATRICVRKDVRSDRVRSLTLAHLLYKALYHWSMRNSIGRLITIVEKRYYILLKRSGFPFVALGDFLPLGDGVLSGIISLDWKEFDSVLSVKRPEFYEWFVRLPDFDPVRSLSHGLY